MEHSVEVLKRLEAEFTKKAVRNFATEMLENYTSYSSTYLLESRFRDAFGSKPSLYGIEDIRKILNEMLLRYYHNEAYIKYRFVKSVLSKEKLVGAYEVSLGNSRADLCSFGNCTRAYEIKTNYDTLNRLEKQLKDYLEAFEYVYVICPEKRFEEVLAIAPEEVGIIVYKEKSTSTGFSKKKNACRSTGLNPMKQAKLANIGDADKLSSAKINSIFKTVNKNKYQKKWRFLIDHSKEIYPLDYQWSFKYLAIPSYA